MRRVRHRMDHAGYTSFEEYLDVLQASSDEFAALFNTILINVTAFFRDRTPGSSSATRSFRAAGRARPNDPIRVWSAGCASGQEAYTLAMILAEALGEAFRQRVKIYATDVDDEALTEARRHPTTRKAVESVPRICWRAISSRSTAAMFSTRICAARSSSAATTWFRTRRFPASICWCAGTP